MVGPCSFHVDWMHSILIPCGMDAFHAHSMWNPCGIHVDIPCGLHVDIPPFHVEFGYSLTIPYGVHVESMWSPCGVHVEWRPQNEWDVSQNVFHMKWWSPCGVHVECGGRVKTSIRQ